MPGEGRGPGEGNVPGVGSLPRVPAGVMIARATSLAAALPEPSEHFHPAWPEPRGCPGGTLAAERRTGKLDARRHHSKCPGMSLPSRYWAGT